MNNGKSSNLYSLEDIEGAAKVAHALSSPIRLTILKLLITRSMTMGELAKELYVSSSSVSMHVKTLESVGLVSAVPKPGMHGAQKLCGITSEKIIFDFFDKLSNDDLNFKIETLHIPIGTYSYANVSSPCGMVSSASYIGVEDTPHVFYNINRINAELIWFTKGYLQYSVSNQLFKTKNVKSIDISFEVCAEAPGYNNNWPSSLFLSLNNKKIITFDVKGDYGGARAINTPSWWTTSNTQYGEFKRISINHKGTYLNNSLVSDCTINSFDFKSNYFFTMNIGTDDDGEFAGGINLFGKNFGNYPQDIKIDIKYI